MSELAAEVSVVTIKDLWQAQQAQTDKLTEGLNGVKQVLERLSGHLDAIDAFTAAAKDVHVDHETRLRSLERWRYALPASLLLGSGSAVTAVLSWLQAIHH